MTLAAVVGLLLGLAPVDAAAQVVTIYSDSAPEGSGITLGFHVQLSRTASADVVLGYSSGDDDTVGANQATAGTDYTAVSGSLTISAGTLDGFIWVDPIDDTDIEGDETFKVTITGTTLPAGVTIGTATAVGTIQEDDWADVSVGAASETEGSSLSFTVKLSEAVASDVVLGWSTGDDDTAGARQATAGTDYTAETDGSVTIAASQTTATLTVQTTADTTAEYNETFKVTISGTTLPGGVRIVTATAVGTIVDDDTATVSVEDASATEGSAVSFTVRLSAAAGADVVLGYSTGADDTAGASQATAGTDYTAVTGGSVTITAGDTTATLTVQTTADTTVEGDETFKVTISGTTLPGSVTIATATAVGTIVNAAPTVSVEAASATEGSAVSFTVRLSAAVSADVVLGWSTSADDTAGASQATAGTDYTAVTGGSATITAGDTTATLTVQTTADTTAEDDETFKVTITGTTLPAGVVLGTATAVGTIVDAVTVSVQGFAAFEGTQMSFLVTLSKPFDSDLQVAIRTFDDDTPGASQATAGTDNTAGTDYLGLSTYLDFPAGATRSTRFAITSIGDTAVEGDETFMVRISERSGNELPAGVVLGTTTAVGTIVDVDGGKLSIEDASATEGSPVKFKVTLSEPKTFDVQLGWRTGDDDTAGARQATKGTDYSATGGRSTFEAGQTTLTIEVQTTRDSVGEYDETFKMTFHGSHLTAVGTIVDDDGAVRASVEAASATEGSPLSFKVKLSQAVSSDVYMIIETIDDDTPGASQATAGTDYQSGRVGRRVRAGETESAVFSVTTVADTDIEGDETFKVQISESINNPHPAGVIIGTATAVGTIVDDDTVTVSVEAASATEGSALSFTVRLSKAASADVVLGWSTGADDTEGASQATAGTDYTAVTGGSVTIATGDTTATLTVQTTAESAAESDETFKVTITGTTLPAEVVLGTATAVGTIVDDDTVTVSVEAASATEGSPLSFTVRLSKAASADVVLAWATGSVSPRAGRAYPGTDYTVVTDGSVTITAGNTTATLTVQTTADTDIEADEVFLVGISGTTLPAGVVIGDATAVGTIVSDDTATVSVEAASATEGSSLSFTVRLSQAVTSDVVLDWRTNDDDTAGARQATWGTDYTSALLGGSATITASQTTATLTVQTTADTDVEGDETFKVTISGTTLPAGVTIGTATAVGTILDDDAVSVSVEAASATEGSALSFTVRLTKAASADVVLAWSTGDDDTAGASQATAGTDYTAVTSGSVTIATGDTTATLTVQTTAESAAESDETFKVTISGTTLPTGVFIRTATAVGTIVDDDAVTVSVEAASATEGSSLSFTVRLSAAASADVVLAWSTGSVPADTVQAWLTQSPPLRLGQATAGTDYTAVTDGSVTITAGDTTATLTVQTTADSVVEGHEAFLVTISGTTLPEGVVIGEAIGVGTILDDDAVTVSVEAASATEGSSLSFTVRLSAAAGADVVLGYSTGADDTAGARQATAGTDYTAVTGGSATITAGDTTGTLTVQTTADTTAEGDETFKVTIGVTTPAAGVTITTATAVGTIVEDDGARVSVEAASATEGSSLSFTVRLSKAVPSDVVLGWSTGADDTAGARQATAGTDYTAVTDGSVTITASQTTATLTVQTTADTDVEGDETFKVTITGTTLPAGVFLGTATAVGTIEDDDAVTVSVEAASATEASALSFAVRLSKAASADVVLGWSTGADDTAGASRATAGTDYTAVTGGSVTITAGDTTATLTVQTTADTDVETDETFKVTITGTTLPAGVFLGTATAVGTIVDDDAATVSVEAALATEGSALSFTVRLSEAVTSDVVLGWSTGDDDTAGARRATAGGDYTAVTGGSVTITAGQTTATLTVQTTADTTVEGDETFKVTITGTTLPGDVRIKTATAVGTIVNDAGTVSVEAASATEGSAVSFTVRLSVAASADVVLGWSTGDDDTAGARRATAGTDYTAVTGGSVTITAGQTTATLWVRTTADTTVEGDETFKVTITPTTLPAGVFLGTTTAVGTIVDDVRVTVSVEAASATEGSALSFTVRLSDAASADVVLGWSTGDDDTAGARQATAGTDYTAVTGGSVTIAASQTTATLTVQATADTTAEGDETFTVTITGTTLPAEVFIGTATAVGTILDDDEGTPPPPDEGTPPPPPEGPAPTVSASCDPCEVRPGAEVRLRATASAPTGNTLRYEWSARAGNFVGPTNEAEARWTAPGIAGQVTIRVRVSDGRGGSSSATVTVRVVNQAPVAKDDETTTDEDQHVTVDVLDNDTDPDGDRLRVVSASGAAHGMAALAMGGVLYAPEANYHGTDRFTYVVSDEYGATATATVEVTVLPVNDAPEVIGVIPDQRLEEGGVETTVELTPFFGDVDGDALTYRAAVSDALVVTAAVSGTVLTLAPVEHGSAVVTVTAEDGGGLTATQVFAVGVSDRLARWAVSATLAGLARAHVASVRTTVGRRLMPGAGQGSRLTVLGRAVPLTREAARAQAESMVANWLWGALPAGAGQYGADGGAGSGPPTFGGITAGVTGSGSGMAGSDRAGSGASSGAASLPGLGTALSFNGGADPWRGSEFLLTLGGGQEGEEARGRRWHAWGSGDMQAFQGAPSAVFDYDGALLTGYLGVDTRLTERWLAGMALSRSRGDGDWRAGGSRGSLTATMTALHPYAQWSDGATSVWTTAGGGVGSAENERRSGRIGESGLNLGMGLVEVRRRLGWRAGGLEFGMRADAAWAQLRTGSGEETIDGQRATVSQARVGADLSRAEPVRLGRVTLAPFGEIHLRGDRGAGERGAGLELSAGARAAAGRVRLEALGRLLVVHSAAEYRERGVAVRLSVAPSEQEGLTVSVSPRWGDAVGGGGALWQDHPYRQQAAAGGREAWALEARGGYGLRLRSGRLLTWFGSYDHSRSGRRFLIGGRLGRFD